MDLEDKAVYERATGYILYCSQVSRGADVGIFVSKMVLLCAVVAPPVALACAFAQCGFFFLFLFNSIVGLFKNSFIIETMLVSHDFYSIPLPN